MHLYNVFIIVLNFFTIIYGDEIRVNGKVRLILHSPEGELSINVEDVQQLCEADQFDRKLNTVFYAYGFTYDNESKDTLEFLKVMSPKYNAIVVDWNPLNLKPYASAAQNDMNVGKYVAEKLEVLFECGALKRETTYLVGHSLGAQMMGQIGRSLEKPVEMIIGLDPANPSFLTYPFLPCISSNDASFVMIIHTDGNSYGIMPPRGHVDFYPNGGRRMQKGCSIENEMPGFVKDGNKFIQVATNKQGKMEKEYPCSHSRAFEYFFQSFTLPLKAQKCNFMNVGELSTCVTQKNGEFIYLRGFHKPRLTGTFYIDTNSKAPY